MELTIPEHLRRLELHTLKYSLWPGVDDQPSPLSPVDSAELQSLEMRLQQSQGAYPAFSRPPYNDAAETLLAPVQGTETDTVVVVTG
jgi:hypothetical protein